MSSIAKRVIEVALVLVPGLLLLMGLLTGTFDVTLGALLPLAAVVLLACGVWTQHWVAYVVLLAVGVACFFAQGLIALAFWVIGGLYCVIAAVNLILMIRKNRP